VSHIYIPQFLEIKSSNPQSSTIKEEGSMKKVLYILIVASLLAMSTSCAQNPPATTAPVESQPATAAPVESQPTAAPVEQTGGLPFAGKTLHFQGSAITTPGQEDAINEVNAAFEKEYGAKVVTNFTGQWSDIPQQLQTSRMAGEPVDITTCGANQINSTLVRSGVIMDITDIVKPIQDRWVDGMFNSYTINDHVWAIPWTSGASTSAVFYNATMFKELNIPEPKTFADVVAAAKIIKEKKPDVMPWIHQGKLQFMWPMWFFETFAQTSGNKSIQYTKDFLSGNRKFTSPEEVAAFAALKPFFDEGVLTQASLDTDGTGMDTAFGQQKAAMLYAGTWEIPNIHAAVNDAFEVGLLEFPLVTSDPNVVSQHGGGPDSCLAVPSFAPQEDLPMIAQYFEFISRADNANKILGPATPMLPLLKSVKAADDPFAAELNEVFIPHTIGFLDWIWPAEVNDAVMQGIPAVMTGQITAEEAAANVQKAFDTLVAEQNYKFDWWTNWTQDDWAKVTPQSIPTYEVKQ
jgi:raffinose/stachyose/melibiose transport system substrate-binding protein